MKPTKLSPKQNLDDEIDEIECEYEEEDAEEEKKEETIPQTTTSMTKTYNGNVTNMIINNKKCLTDSEYLLKPQLIHVQNRNNDKFHCNLSNCYDMDLLQATLLQYHSFIRLDQHKKLSTFEVDIVSLLNSFHHLLFVHQHEFDDIYNMLVEKSNDKIFCLLKNCSLIRRNQRQRVYYLYFTDDTNDITVQQIMDTIHCYFFHSYDVGYKFTKEEKEEIRCETDEEHKENESSDRIIAYIHQRMQSKQKVCRNISGLERITNSQKFITQTTKSKGNETDIMYDFGIKYFYWNYYKENEHSNDPATYSTERGYLTLTANDGYKVKNWYIKSIFENLKQELLQNKISCISHQEWDSLRLKAIKHTETNFAKTLKCVGHDRAEIYRIPIDECISAEHIIAMMVYCNYDTLQAKFSKTFRINEEYSTNELLKEAHQNYVHLGRLLREFTDCFGTTASEVLRDRLLPLYYHGVSKQVNFKSIAAHIKGPMSSSTDYAVAANFCANKGVILEFSLSTAHFYGRDAFVHCSWLSAFANEQEVFFIGGYNLVFFNSIITAGGLNYCEYIKGMRILNETLSESVTAAITNDQSLTMCCRLLKHRLYKCDPNNTHSEEFKTMPKYMEKLLDNYCDSVSAIVFWNMHIVMDTSATMHATGSKWSITGLRNWLQSIFFYDFGWVNVPLLMKVFPTLKQLIIHPLYFLVHNICPSDMINNPSFGERLIQFFKTNHIKTLQRITICVYEKDYRSFYQACVTFNQKYSLYLQIFKWKLYVEQEGEGRCKILHLLSSEYEENCRATENVRTKEVAVQTEPNYFKQMKTTKVKQFVRGECLDVKVVDENQESCWTKGVICMITEQKILIHFSRFKPRWISKNSPDIAPSGTFV